MFELIRSAENLGFGAANNLAIEASRGRYVVLLNSDAFLCPGSLRGASRIWSVLRRWL